VDVEKKSLSKTITLTKPLTPEYNIVFCILVAWQASWRLAIFLFGVIVVPALTSLSILNILNFDVATFVGVVLTTIFFPMSIFTHELGHVIAYCILTRKLEKKILKPLGKWTKASIIRNTAGLENDVIISMAGPVGGLLAIIPVAFSGGNFLILAPWSALFFIHLFSLFPWLADGKQVAFFIQRKISHATSK